MITKMEIFFIRYRTRKSDFPENLNLPQASKKQWFCILAVLGKIESQELQSRLRVQRGKR